MKIWNEIGSSHSTHVSIIGDFENRKDAEKVIPIIKDLIIGHETGINGIKGFYNKWKTVIPTEGGRIYEQEFNDEIETYLDIELKGNSVHIEAYKLNEFTGILKILFMCHSENIKFSGTPN